MDVVHDDVDQEMPPSPPTPEQTTPATASAFGEAGAAGELKEGEGVCGPPRNISELSDADLYDDDSDDDDDDDVTAAGATAFVPGARCALSVKEFLQVEDDFDSSAYLSPSSTAGGSNNANRGEEGASAYMATSSSRGVAVEGSSRAGAADAALDAIPPSQTTTKLQDFFRVEENFNTTAYNSDDGAPEVVAAAHRTPTSAATPAEALAPSPSHTNDEVGGQHRNQSGSGAYFYVTCAGIQDACAHVCVCTCVRVLEREQASEQGREGERERGLRV